MSQTITPTRRTGSARTTTRRFPAAFTIAAAAVAIVLAGWSGTHPAVGTQVEALSTVAVSTVAVASSAPTAQLTALSTQSPGVVLSSCDDCGGTADCHHCGGSGDTHNEMGGAHGVGSCHSCKGSGFCQSCIDDD
jgi:hypothetical protein